MEIINPTPCQNRGAVIGQQAGSCQSRIRKIYIGSLLVVAGGVWLLNNLGVLAPAVFDVLFSWQMLMVVIGGFLLVHRNWVAGSLVTGAGIGFLISDFLHIDISLGKVILPVVLIVCGFAVLFGRK